MNNKSLSQNKCDRGKISEGDKNEPKEDLSAMDNPRRILGSNQGKIAKKERDPYLDHGTFVPLHFLREVGVDCPILRIGLFGFSPLDHYRLGQCIAQAMKGLGRRAVPCRGDHPPGSQRERQRGGDGELLRIEVLP